MVEIKCSFCNLIEAKEPLTNLTTFEEELGCDLLEISAEILNIQIEHGYTCNDCKNDLILSYKFKQKASVVLDSFKNALKHEIFRVFNKFLNETENIAELAIMKYNDCIALVDEEEREKMEIQGWQEMTSQSHLSQLEVELHDSFVKEEPTMGELVSSYLYENAGENEDLYRAETLNQFVPHQRRIRRRTPKLAKVLKLCRVYEEQTVFWTCCFCKKVTCATHTGLRMHLLKYHPEEVEEEPDANQPKPVKQVIDETDKPERDPNWIKQMVDNSQNGLFSWRCCLCNDTTSSSYFGMRIHITRMHCRKPEARKVLEKFDRNIVWLNEMIEKSRCEDESDVWKCILCKDFKTQHRFGLQAHITKMHCKKEAASSRVEDELEVESDSKQTTDDRHERDPEWTKQMVNESKVADDHWVCKICENFESHHQRGIQLHIIRIHCKRQQKQFDAADEFDNNDGVDKNEMEIEDTSSERSWPKLYQLGETLKQGTLNDDFQKETKDSTEAEKHERDAAWIRMKINECQVNEGLWQCNVCEAFTSKSRLGFRIHIIRKHYKPRQVEDESNNESDQETDWAENKAVEIKRNFKANSRFKKWAKEMYRKSVNLAKTESSGENTISVCFVCKTFTCGSNRGMWLHIVRRHRSMNKFHPLKTPRPRGRPRINIKPFQVDSNQYKKKIMTAEGNVDFWICSHEPCRNLVYNSETEFREHYNKNHLKKDSIPKQSKNLSSSMKVMNQNEREWLKKKIKQSKTVIGNEHKFKCHLCNKVYNHDPNIRYHFITRHLPFFRRGIEGYEQHERKFKQEVASEERDSC